jgi:uncharacterized protein (TIGR04255 family)
MSDTASPLLPRLPTRITPCSIINTVVEVRFQTELSASFVPGMIYSAVHERFPKRTELPHVPLPDAANVFPELRYNPAVVMQGVQLSLSVGPRCLFLSLPVGTEYPGWTVYRESLAWVLERIRPLAVIGAPERLGLRYTDFFPHPLSECLRVDLAIGARSEISQPLHIVSTLPRDRMQCQVQITHPAIKDVDRNSQQGTLLDVDMGFSVPVDQFWEAAVPAFDYAHKVQKNLFFGELLKPTFLATLQPEY